MKRKVLLLLLWCIGAILFPLSTFAVSGYVGDQFDLARPNVPYNATKIKSVTWSGQYSSGISCYETSTGLHVTITSFFTGSISISCEINYEWQSGDRTLTSRVSKSYSVMCSQVDINVYNEQMTMKAGQTERISYSLSPSKNVTLTFESSNTSVATVSSSGEVKAVGQGTATITIKQNMGYSAYCYVTVTEPVAATSVSLPATAEVYAYSSIVLKATIQPTEATSTLKWKSGDTRIATVDQSGKVTGNAPGTTTVTVTTDNDLSASCEVTVKDVDRTPRSFDIGDEFSQKAVYVGDTWKVAYTVMPSYANYTLSWTSSDESVAKVSAYGEVEALRQGTARITGSIEGSSLTGYCDVTVKGVPNVLTIWFVNGQRTDIQLSEHINMIHQGAKFVVKSATVDVEYDDIDVSKFSLESDGSNDTGVKPIRLNDSARGMMSYDGNAIFLSGFPPNSAVQLFTVKGQASGTYRIGQNGSLTIPVDGLPRGIHLVKTESITYKIIKK